MARKKKPDIELSPEAAAAYDRVVGLAQQLAAMLLGEELSAAGEVQTPHAAAIAMGMFFFLLRIGPDDLHALFFAEGSLNQCEFKPYPPGYKIKPILADLMMMQKRPGLDAGFMQTDH